MDFYKIMERSTVRGRGEKQEVVSIDIYPDFIVKRSKDLMVRGKSFYAIWNEKEKLWSQDEYDVVLLVDEDLYAYRDALKENTRTGDIPVKVLTMASNRSRTWTEYKRYISSLSDSYHTLDEKLTFLNTDVKKEDYVSKKLGYSLEEGDYSAWDKLVSTLYDPKEREKIEWAIGAIVSGDSKTIQKFCVFYGDPGTGKGTIITVIQKLFAGYYITFNAKDLASANNQFSTEVFRSNPLVAIQHDGDLSRIEDNTKLNSIVSHEMMVINEKGKPQYMGKMNAFLFMGTNRPVRITDSRSGIIRRLIDIFPSGRTFSAKEYEVLMSQIEFELGAIAYHCLEVYRDLGKNYFKNYTPKDMIMKTDVFYNFVEANLEVFEEQKEGITLKQAYSLYKEYCDDALVEFKLPRYKFREELKAYFKEFSDLIRIDGKPVRSWYSGFKHEKMEAPVLKREEHALPLTFDYEESLLDDILKDCPAQYATEDEEERPERSWAKCKTTIKDIDTKRIHYVLPQALNVANPLIMIDFDKKNEEGEKDMLLNMEAASKWKKTYGEFSKGGAGIHLIYWYDGDVGELSSLFEPGVEIKTFVGNGPMRRRVSKCNNIPIATLNRGSLPLKEDKVIDTHELSDQKHLINKIKKSLRKGDNVGGTKCEVEFIKKTLDDAYNSGMSYDLSDYEHDVLMLAMSSTNNSDYCTQLVSQMKFVSKDALADKLESDQESTKPLTFFDIEIYPPGIDEDGEDNPGLFLICWKIEGEGQEVHSMENPKPYEVENFLKFKLAGYNNLSYDNPMLYYAALGYNNAKLYDLSRRIIVEKAKDAIPYESKNISYCDVYDFCSEKKSLKKWEIDLDISHIEMGIPWDKPAPRRLWPHIVEYCKNDVLATEAVFNARKADFIAREILADISKGKVNDSTNKLTEKFILEGNKHPNLVYTELATGERSDGSHNDSIIGAFPGYKYVAPWESEDGKRHNMFRGIDLGFGGYSYAEPGVYTDVALIDIQSMHPSSIVAMNYFGDYTQRFKDILDTRLAIKNGDYETARKMFGGALAKYLEDESNADGLAQALKIAINSVYGLTSASFENAFKDKRNINNIVALRGALFMKTLLDELQSMGWTVAHLKVDSMKIPNATPEIIQFCMDFAKKYGYSFAHEATYDRMCLIDKAQYVAAYKSPEDCEKMYGYVPSDNRKHFKKHTHPWTTTGDAFQHPYIFKTLFSGEEVTFKDRCETKSVRDAAIYLDFNENGNYVEDAEKEMEKRMWNQSHPNEKPKRLNPKFEGFSDKSLNEYILDGHHYVFVGRVGSFFPVRPGEGGGLLLSYRNDKFGSVNGAKGYRWMEAEVVKACHKEDCYDPKYFDSLIDGAIKAAEEFCDFKKFIDISRHYETSELRVSKAKDEVPWSVVPCGDGKYNTCMDCPHCSGDTCHRGYSLASYLEGGSSQAKQAS